MLGRADDDGGFVLVAEEGVEAVDVAGEEAGVVTTTSAYSWERAGAISGVRSWR